MFRGKTLPSQREDILVLEPLELCYGGTRGSPDKRKNRVRKKMKSAMR